MYICGCIALSDGQNRDVIWMISIFGVIAVLFGQNVGILPPLVSTYRVSPHWYGIYLEEI
jgi:hypothetical protein